MRGIITLISLSFLLLLIAMAFIQVLRGYFDTREFFEIILPVVASLATGAVGYYFGSQHPEH